MIGPMLSLLKGPQAFLYAVCPCAGVRTLGMGGTWQWENESPSGQALVRLMTGTLGKDVSLAWG